MGFMALYFSTFLPENLELFLFFDFNYVLIIFKYIFKYFSCTN